MLNHVGLHFSQGSLPLMLTFDLREEAEPDPIAVSKLYEKYDVIISIKPKPKLSVKSVNIRGYERNSGNLKCTQIVHCEHFYPSNDDNVFMRLLVLN